jgi:hypothetical protein
MNLLELLAFRGKLLEPPTLRSDQREQKRVGNHCGHRHRKGAKRDMRRDGHTRNVGGQISTWRNRRAS